MKKNKPLVKDKERAILQLIDSSGTSTANEISKETGISYVTVQKYLKKLVKEGILEEENGEEKDNQKK